MRKRSNRRGGGAKGAGAEELPPALVAESAAVAILEAHPLQAHLVELVFERTKYVWVSHVRPGLRCWMSSGVFWV